MAKKFTEQVTEVLSEQVASLFGMEIKRPDEQPTQPSFAPKTDDDGAVVMSTAVGGSYAQSVDLEGLIKNEADLVNKYRDMAQHPEVDAAIDDIVNESIVTSDEEEAVEIMLDDCDLLPSQVKKVIEQEFKEILRLLEFNTKQYDVFRRWYVDGRLYYHVIVDLAKPQEGIQELRYLDPRKIRKIRQVAKKRDQMHPNITIPQVVNEYFLYSDKALNSGGKTMVPQQSVGGLKIAKDSIIHCTSGITDTSGNLIIGHLHKAIKPLNCLRSLEDACVIYSITRAPERRVFYIDTGNLPKIKAEQLIRDVMVRHKNKLTYDVQTGEVRDDRRFMTMIEDFYLGRAEGGRGTQIDTLKGGEHIGETGHIEYFQDKLLKSMNVPISRLKPEEAIYSTGRATEITRDEIKFAKFIDRLQIRFNGLFLKALEKQLVLKQILTPEDWDAVQYNIKFRYHKDNYFSELKESEIFGERFARLQQIDPMGPYAGQYVSKYWVRKNILRLTDEEMEEEDQRILDETTNPQFMQNIAEPGLDDGMGGPMPDDGAGLPPQGGGGSGSDATEPTEPSQPTKPKNK